MKIDGVKAILFDFDGVLVNSKDFVINSIIQVGKELGYNFTYTEVVDNIFGRASLEGLKILIQMKGFEIPEDLEERYQKARMKQDDIFPQMTEVFEPSLKFLEKYQNKTLMAICSATRRRKLQNFLNYYGMKDFFKFEITVEDVERSKPFPDCYLLGVKMYKEKFGVEKENIIAVEDSISGVTSAIEAGLRCVAVTQTTPKELLSHATYIVDSLADIEI